jgi:hypothetical protein
MQHDGASLAHCGFVGVEACHLSVGLIGGTKLLAALCEAFQPPLGQLGCPRDLGRLLRRVLPGATVVGDRQRFFCLR